MHCAYNHAEFPAESRGIVSVELLLLPDARLQGSNHHVRAACEGVPQRRRVQGEQEHSQDSYLVVRFSEKLSPQLPMTRLSPRTITFLLRWHPNHL